ncbi:hypothetical protein [Sphingobium sp. 15-1]|uniref:hypothetical protein n=2 Tax=Sphingobium sp. 15-1 TaxID=2729616 RepID=UPI001C3F8EE9|nr:hypothetical protein [Sphingobium sp. 15-1]
MTYDMIRLVDHEGYRNPATGAGRIGCAVASIFGIVFGLPFFFIATYASGGCEGAPQPCKSDNTWFWLALLIIALSCTGVGLLTRSTILRFQRRKR